jgi:hypothetical protein
MHPTLTLVVLIWPSLLSLLLCSEKMTKTSGARLEPLPAGGQADMTGLKGKVAEWYELYDVI